MNLGTPEEIIELISNYQSTIVELKSQINAQESELSQMKDGVAPQCAYCWNTKDLENKPIAGGGGIYSCKDMVACKSRMVYHVERLLRLMSQRGDYEIERLNKRIAELEPLASVGLAHMPGQTFHTLACAVNSGGKCDCGGLK